MLAPATIDTVDGYWAAFLGVPRSRLRPPHPLAIPHAAELSGYRGIYVQAFGAAPLVSLPAELFVPCGQAAAEAAAQGLEEDADRWRAVFGERVDRLVGPAVISYADAGTFRGVSIAAELRPLTEADRPALAALRGAMPAEEWDHGGGEYDGTTVFGAFLDGVLAARAGYEVWAGRIAHLGAVTHPAHRGRGLGAAVFASATRAALEAGLVAQHRALQSNTNSLRIARRLGFVPCATSLAVRLRDE
ncbi:MAG TPA: GNAT family N-acetyltransferase [Longimicrobium sp.]|nr:GNAT family N-acetyltransferase [Longimicrobium sp.]